MLISGSFFSLEAVSTEKILVQLPGYFDNEMINPVNNLAFVAFGDVDFEQNFL